MADLEYTAGCLRHRWLAGVQQSFREFDRKAEVSGGGVAETFQFLILFSKFGDLFLSALFELVSFSFRARVVACRNEILTNQLVTLNSVAHGR